MKRALVVLLFIFVFYWIGAFVATVFDVNFVVGTMSSGMYGLFEFVAMIVGAMIGLRVSR